jgi:hypothetical protein
VESYGENLRESASVEIHLICKLASPAIQRPGLRVLHTAAALNAFFECAKGTFVASFSLLTLQWLEQFNWECADEMPYGCSFVPLL